MTQDKTFAVQNKPSQCHARNPSNYTEVTPPINSPLTSSSLHAPVVWCSSKYVSCYMSQVLVYFIFYFKFLLYHTVRCIPKFSGTEMANTGPP